MTDFAITRPAAPLFGGRIQTFFAGVAEGLRRYQSFRVACAELEMLSDRELADLGIARREIAAVAAKAARG
ncbi:DUF1127 domain-containing protein [Mangrovicoccus algicola]|uniref:DUF1127 domain-containing protein n=1 Tax=Mangrovicoccus algicola TaxID=2771008 RepID=A0A8J6YXD4_9RHOB|nr:DUF1127 domain-containing protein [Mangrovicoccus algicola]MBE3637596.1 DUF1127 domain-containing protein [Mangrovicoccus algicola]